MLKFIEDKKGILGITLSQIGLILATGILLAAVFSIIFLNDWNKKAEMKNVATSLSTIVEGMDTRFFENKTTYWFPSTDYSYTLTASTEFIVATSKGYMDDILSHKERFLIKPWPRSANPKWTTGKELHDYLKTNYTQSGNKSDPIQPANIDDVKDEILKDREKANKLFALNPMQFNLSKPLYIEKIFIYYDKDDDGWDKTVDEKQDFVIIYQI